MNVHIARDGEIIGEHEESELEALARSGELQTTDHYWHEGMEEWSLLPQLIGWQPWEPPPPTTNRLLVAGAIAAATVVAVAVSYFLVTPEAKLPEAIPQRSASAPASDDIPARERELRDKAVADLRQRIERLPAHAAPPLNAFYYDVSVQMKKSYASGTPWTAVIHGGENVVDPATEKTVRRTEFTLTTDYRNAEWIYRSYRASAAEMDHFAVTQIEHDGTMAAPPSLIGMLGLKTERP